MRRTTKQKGMGSIAWLVVIAIAGFALLCFFKIGPPYLDDRFVSGMLKTLAENNPGLGQMSKGEVKSAINKYLTVNSIRGDTAKSFKIVRTQEGILINSNYEVRVNLVGNIDVVLSFKHQLDSQNPDACCEYLIEDDES